MKSERHNCINCGNLKAVQLVGYTDKDEKVYRCFTYKSRCYAEYVFRNGEWYKRLHKYKKNLR